MSRAWPYWLNAHMRKLLSESGHFSPHSDQYVTCMDSVSSESRSVRLFSPFPETEHQVWKSCANCWDGPHMAELSVQVDWALRSSVLKRLWHSDTVSQTIQHIGQLFCACDKAYAKILIRKEPQGTEKWRCENKADAQSKRITQIIKWRWELSSSRIAACKLLKENEIPPTLKWHPRARRHAWEDKHVVGKPFVNLAIVLASESFLFQVWL